MLRSHINEHNTAVVHSVIYHYSTTKSLLWKDITCAYRIPHSVRSSFFTYVTAGDVAILSGMFCSSRNARDTSWPSRIDCRISEYVSSSTEGTLSMVLDSCCSASFRDGGCFDVVADIEESSCRHFWRYDVIKAEKKDGFEIDKRTTVIIAPNSTAFNRKMSLISAMCLCSQMKNSFCLLTRHRRPVTGTSREH